MDASTALAAGLHGLPHVGTAFAAAQGAWRFFANPKTTLPKLIEPLRQAGRQAAAQSSSALALLVHDWSKLDYDGHKVRRPCHNAPTSSESPAFLAYPGPRYFFSRTMNVYGPAPDLPKLVQTIR